MNIVGVFLWVSVGATALHYWNGYLQENWYTVVDSERQVGFLSIYLVIETNEVIKEHNWF